LLCSGTLGDLFGNNVAKTRKIMMVKRVKYMPYSYDVVEGLFKPKNENITIINLRKYLHLHKFKKTDMTFL